MNSTQLIVVKIGTQNIMKVYEDGKLLKTIDNVWIGKNGAIEIEAKHEGDGKTPLGLFDLGVAFGTHNLNIDYPYIKIQDNDYWVDDSASPYYNQLVRVGEDIPPFNYPYITSLKSKNFNSAEHLKGYEKQYEYAVFIEFNSHQTSNGTIEPSKGSAIFLHCHGDAGYTSGCIAISKEDMEYIMNYLNRNGKPKIKIKKNKVITNNLFF